MMVETYHDKELSDITFDIDKLDEWKRIAENLGLENQLQLTKGCKSPISFPFLNTVMERVYETLCPRKVNFKEYKVTPIPLEVLQIIAFAVNEKHFCKIEIWYNDKVADPIVIGIAAKYEVVDKNWNRIKNDDGSVRLWDTFKEGEDYRKENDLYHCNEINRQQHIVARWGDELRPFSELKTMATERFIEENAGELKKEIAVMTQKLSCIEENTVSYFNGNMDRNQVIGKF